MAAYRPPPMPEAGTAGAYPLGYFRDHYLEETFGDPYADSILMQESISSSEGTSTTRSTVRNVNFRDPPPMATISELNQTIRSTAANVESETKVDTVLTEMIQIGHPRTLQILCALQFALCIQILVFGLICKLYDGCPYYSALWIPCIFIITVVVAFVFIKLRPTKPYLIATLVLNILSLLLCLALFIITAWLLESEDTMLRASGFDAVKEHLFQLNRIVENTKIAMYTLHMVLTPIHGVCCVATIIILCLNLKDAQAGKIRKGYYVSTSPLGHQNVLVPVDLKQVRQVPCTGGKRISVAVQTN